MTYRMQFRRYRLPFRVPIRTAHGIWTERHGVWVRLEDESGTVGFGEAAPLPAFGTETIDEIETACRELGATVDDSQLDAVPRRMTCLRHALAASRSRDSTQPVHSTLGLAALLPAGRIALAQISPRLEIGFRVFKWKVGLDTIADELALLDDICAALPSGAKLRLDANGAWNRRQAERWLERCADRPIEFVEQPIAADARGAADLLLGLANDYPTPLALDESLIGDRDLEHWLGAGWRGVFVVKPALLGDVPRALAQLDQAKASVVFSSALETALGARTALTAAFAWQGEPRALGFGVWPLFADSRFDGPGLPPFLRWEDVQRINPESLWNALN